MTRQFSGPTLLQLFKICCHPLSPADEKEILLAEYLVFAIYYTFFLRNNKWCRNEGRFANLANFSIKTSKFHKKNIPKFFFSFKRLYYNLWVHSSKLANDCSINLENKSFFHKKNIVFILYKIPISNVRRQLDDVPKVVSKESNPTEKVHWNKNLFLLYMRYCSHKLARHSMSRWLSNFYSFYKN